MAEHECWSTSAPAKVILFGEHAVNRGQPALVTAIDLRAYCTISLRADTCYALHSGERHSQWERDDLHALRQEIDDLRATENTEAIRRRAGADFFAPTAYVLARFLAGHPLPGLNITWQSEIPIGAGLGSGAATASAMVLALCNAAEVAYSAAERAHFAWQGDIIAHGGIASGLDSSGTTFGGVVRYTVADGPQPLAAAGPLPLVIGDTGLRASTAEVNGRVRAWLLEHPEGTLLFPQIGSLVEQALDAIAGGDLVQLGSLLDANQALLTHIGVSSPEIARLVRAARTAGALGAKLAGSGGGGIVLALCAEADRPRIAAAIEAAGGRAITTRAGVVGARVEEAPIAA